MGGASKKVTQIAFPESVNNAVHTSGAYASRGTNPMSNAADGIFADSLAGGAGDACRESGERVRRHLPDCDCDRARSSPAMSSACGRWAAFRTPSLRIRPPSRPTAPASG